MASSESTVWQNLCYRFSGRYKKGPVCGNYHKKSDRYCTCCINEYSARFNGGVWDFEQQKEITVAEYEDRQRKPPYCTNLTIYTGEKSDRIQFTHGPAGQETVALEIAPDAFYVRGVKVPQDADEALAVYNGFLQWATGFLGVVYCPAKKPEGTPAEGEINADLPPVCR